MFRAGDAVLHKPSGETWSVAYVEDDRVACRGWPLSFAPVADFDIVRAATDEKHQNVLRDMATMNDKDDPRCRRARLALGLPL